MSNENSQPKQLMMLRTAAPTPRISLREGWSIRSMEPGEGAAWARICISGNFFNTDGIDDGQLWERAMGRDPGVKPENVFFVCDPTGKPVATAAARLISEEERKGYPPTANGLGYLHFVVALPESRGMGAGFAATAAVIRRFDELGLHDCILFTDDQRLAAIKVYLALGWLPVLSAPDMRERWGRVLGLLGVSGETKAYEADGSAAAPVLPLPAG